jgi:hypothetical protein
MRDTPDDSLQAALQKEIRDYTRIPKVTAAEVYGELRDIAQQIQSYPQALRIVARNYGLTLTDLRARYPRLRPAFEEAAAFRRTQERRDPTARNTFRDTAPPHHTPTADSSDTSNSG